MYRKNRTVTALVVIGLALCLATSHALAPGTMLGYRPKQGTAAKYSFTMTQKQGGTVKQKGGASAKMNQDLKMSATVRQVVTKSTDTGTTSSYTFGSAKVTNAGKTVDCAKALNDAKLSSTIDPKGETISADGLANLNGTARPLAVVLQTMVPLPDKAVNVGEKWTRTMKGTPPIKFSCKLVGLETRGGKPVAKVSLTYTGSFDNAKMLEGVTGPDKPPLTKISITGTGVYYVEVASGMPVEATSTMKTKVTGGATLSGTTTMTMKRIGN